MRFAYDASNVHPSGGNMPIPRGKYLLKIESVVEKRSRNGDPMVVVDFRVTDSKYSGRKIRFHHVTFLPPEAKGAGMAIHFLKSIGEPFEGAIAIESARWIGKTLYGLVEQEPDLNGVPRNVVREVESLAEGAALKDEEGVPF
jgi:hypothetical protein